MTWMDIYQSELKEGYMVMCEAHRRYFNEIEDSIYEKHLKCKVTRTEALIKYKI